MIVYYDNAGKTQFRDLFKASGVDCIPLYRYIPMRYIYMALGSYVPKKLVFNIPEPSRDDDKIIVFDTHVTPQYLHWLCKRFPEKRILMWYWNPVGQGRHFDLFPRRVEVWSYSPEDCERYGFRYNSQFYFDCIAKAESRKNPEAYTRPQVFFLGRDKGRKQEILDLQTQLEQSGADTDFHFMKDYIKKNWNEEPIVPYKDVLKLIRQSDVLLDYTLIENAGLSLRPMEALFFRKKLITNQKSIEQYDFYRKENIYILGEDKRSIREFLEEPYIQLDQGIRDFYLLSNWLKRFDQPEDEKR